MTDPFFTTGNTAGNNTTQNNNPQQINNTTWNANVSSNVQAQTNTNSATVATPADQIKVLNDQQQQIQIKYQELKALYNGEWAQKLNIEQKQQVQEQMQKLSDLYTQNKQTLTLLTTNIDGEKQVQINKNVVVKQQKKNKKLSFKWIMLWCVVLFIFIVWWLAAVFYYLIQNPNQLSSVGIDPQTATQLLQTFATIFFGLLFFASLGMLITNFYRLTTSKNKRKIWYIFWIIFGFIILIGTLIWWAKVLNMLKTIEVNDFVDSNSILSALWEKAWPITADWSISNPEYTLRDSTSYPLIAPANIKYKINKTIFDNKVMPQLWNVNVTNAILDCGNGQELVVWGYDTVWACMYKEKWKYPLKLILTTTNNETAEQTTMDIEAGELDIRSQVEIRTNQWPVEFSNNEIIAWKNPIKITYDASSVFTDFQLPDYKVVWDVDGDGVADKSDLSTYTHLYTWASKYYAKVKYPWLNDHIYIIPIRVEQSDVPVAQINYDAITETRYKITANFFGDKPDISEYIFNILDKKAHQKIDSITSDKPNINYTFPWNWTYAVQMSFVTQEWKQWLAESENIQIGDSDFMILYDTYVKTPTDPQFKKLELNDADSENGWVEELALKEIPTIIRFDITKIIPSSPSIETQVLVDWSPIVSTDNSFQTTIDSNKNYNIKIIVTDPNHKTTTEKEIKISVDRDDIIWKLIVSPDTVWVSPFTVKFDASTTTINDPKDEIVYFTWDFGDGEVKENLSQSIISHTYTYDFESENGQFYPNVIIKTKKWRELVVWSWTMILVKKPNVTLDINLDSHPAQTANIWDKVDMSLDIDWLPDKVVWDFGNWNTLECGGRECIQASQIYNVDWEYTISATVTYPNKPTIEWKINLIVK